MADDYLRTRTVELMRQYPSMRLDAILCLARSEMQQRLDADERPSSPPAGRLVGAERNG